MIDVVHGKIVTHKRTHVRHEMVVGPAGAPEKMQKYAFRVLQSLPQRVDGLADRENRVAALAIAMISELAHLPAEDAKAFVQTLMTAYEEMIPWYAADRRCA